MGKTLRVSVPLAWLIIFDLDDSLSSEAFLILTRHPLLVSLYFFGSCFIQYNTQVASLACCRLRVRPKPDGGSCRRERHTIQSSDRDSEIKDRRWMFNQSQRARSSLAGTVPLRTLALVRKSRFESLRVEVLI
jgi:hypothetical protein